MEFSIFLPPAAELGRCPVLYFLSGLTCTWENATTKAGFQRIAAALGLIVVCPDTSPRGKDVPGDPDGAYDFGHGAGFYLDASEPPWSSNYRMGEYVVEEVPALLAREFAIGTERVGITGHSMGGHGALTLALKHPDRYRSVSAFSPIVAPSQVPWGQKAFSRYIGEDRHAWARHDACALVNELGWPRDILVDQGEADDFLRTQLRPDLLQKTCEDRGVALTLRMWPGYDHSYYFISSFMESHLRYHAERLT